ncbi:MAG: hypothetical protein HXS54_11455 [Theionarchaea archaeon]|nr:hypothetical protein [Theionarchaea archaeon]
MEVPKLVDWTGQILGLIIIAIIGTIFIHIGAKLAGISNATITKAFEVALIGAVLFVILNNIISIGGLIGLILLIAVIKYIYDTSWGKAIVAWILFIIVIIVVIVILVTIAGVTIFSLLG